MAILWAAKRMLWKHLLGRVRFDHKISLVDSSTVAVCRFGRAYRCRRLAKESAFGYDEMGKQTFYGLRVHLKMCWAEVIVDVDPVPANAHELQLAEELLKGTEG